MRLLHVINSSNPRGGGPIEAIVQSVRELSPRGHESEILCVDPPNSSWLSQVSCDVHALGPAVTSYRYSGKVRGWLSENIHRFDAALVHSLWQHPGHELARAAIKAEVPYFVYTHGSLDPAHKRVFWHKHPQKAAMWIVRERSFLENARGIFFTCEEERQLALQSFWPRLSGRNTDIVPYCTGDPPADESRQRQSFLNAFPQLADRPFLLFLSRLHPKKGPDLLLAAFAEVRELLPDYFLVMAGPGSDAYVQMLKNHARRLNITDAVVWTGMLTDDLKWGAFRMADAFVLCSHQENFGIAVVESLACRLPVLTTDRVNIWRTIADANAGFIGSDTQVSCLELLRKWASLSPSERDLMRSNARRCFEINYSAHNAAERLLESLRNWGVDAQSSVSKSADHIS